MSARTRRSLTLTWTALFVLSLLLQYFAFAAAPPALAAHNEGIFELDGNAEAEAAPGDDWSNPANAADFFFVGEASEAADNDVTYFTGGGSKDENDVPEWAITDNSVPDKDELLDAYAAVYQSGGDTWVYFGADRFDNDGTAQIGVWFFQDDIGISGNSFTGAHVDGDVLIISEYTNGGVVSSICAYQWDSSGGGDNIDQPFGICDTAASGSNLNLVAAGTGCDVADGIFDICAKTNDDTENAPWPFTNKDGDSDFGPGQFFEGGINLSEMFGGDAPCFGSILTETRTSAETDAQLKDFALGDFNTCVPPDIETESSVSTADFGDEVTDTATFSGSNGAVEGTATFFICEPGETTAAGCPEGSGTPVGDPVTIDGGSATSDAYTVGLTADAVGTYCWRVEYEPAEGSDYLAASHTNATTECFEVEPATIEIEKTADDAAVDAGSEIGFTVTITNTGTGTALGVTVDDPLPGGDGVDWSIDSQSGGWSITGTAPNQTLSFGPASLAAGASATVHVVSDTTADSCGNYPNTASVTTTNDGSDEASAAIDVLCAEIDIEKTANPEGPVIAGDDIGFDVVVSNNGDGSATDVHVDDPLPAGVEWVLGAVSGDTTGVECEITGAVDSQELVCDDDSMAPGDSFSVSISASTDADDCGEFTNTATVTTGNDGEDEATAAVTVLCPDVGVEKTADNSPISAGETAAFTITVTSVGEDTAEDVVLDDTLPAGVDWVVTNVTLNGNAIANPCDPIAGDALHCDLGDLASGDVVVIHIGGETDFDDCGTLHNEVTVGAAAEIEGGDENNSAEADVVVNCPDLGIVKTADHEVSVVAGEEIGFTVTIANLGEGTAFDVEVSDTLPAGFEWEIVSQSGGWSIVGDELSFGPADLAAGAEATVHIVSGTDAADCGLVPNTAVLFQGETTVDDDSASEAVRCPELGIEKSNNAPIETIDVGDGTTIDLPTAEEGDTVTYTLEYTVVDGPVTNAIITDVLPDGVTYVDGTASNDAQFTFVDYDVASRTLTWTAPTASVNGSLTYDATIDVGASELPQPLINVATIDSDETPPDDDESPVFVPPVPLELTPPPTDALAPSATAGNPGFALMLILLAVAGLALTIGFITPVPESVRRRDRLG